MNNENDKQKSFKNLESKKPCKENFKLLVFEQF